MHSRNLLFALAFVILPSILWICPAGTPGQQDDPDATLLALSSVPAEPAKLLAYVNERSGDDADLRRIDELIRQLGDSDFGTREQASKKLAAVGYPALRHLTQAREHHDAEVVSRARTCMDKIESRSNPAVMSAAVRVLARRPSEDVVRALLRYLPYACDQELEDDIWFSLDALPLRQRALAPAFVEGLDDKVPARRAAAGYVLGRRGDRDQQAAAQKLLSDDDPVVRLRVAQGLLGVGRKEALPTLVTLIQEGTIEVAWQAEELLRWVAGKEAPEAIVGTGSREGRKQCRAAWEAWWKKHGDGLNLAELGRRPERPGLVLVLESLRVRHNRVDRVWLCGSDGRPRWQLGDLTDLKDAALLPGGRVLLAEGPPPFPFPRGDRTEVLPGAVTERDLDGTVRWRYQDATHVLVPLSCRRLANGNTLITTPRLVLEVTPEGKQLSARDFYGRNGLVIDYPQVLRTGHFLYQFERRPNCLELIEVDPATARAQRRVELADAIPPSYVVRALPTGHYLVVSPNPEGGVLEVNGQGKTVWQYRVAGAGDALRLRNGNTLITWPGRVAEIDPRGKTMWEVVAKGDGLSLRECFGLLRLGFDR